jgi:hypothetical protein
MSALSQSAASSAIYIKRKANVHEIFSNVTVGKYFPMPKPGETST